MHPSAIDVRSLAFDRIFLPTLAAGAALLAGLGWFLFAHGDAKTDKPKTFKHMHCPACKEEIVYSPKLVGKRCMNCSDGATLVATVGTLEDLAKEPGSAGKIVFFLLAAILLTQGAVFVGIKRLKSLRQLADDFRNRTLLARCPFCKRKVAYAVAKVGTWTTCFQCKTAFELPSDEIAEPTS